MLAYILRRLLYAIPILVGVNLITFALFFVVNTPDFPSSYEQYPQIAALGCLAEVDQAPFGRIRVPHLPGVRETRTYAVMEEVKHTTLIKV